MAEGWEGPKTEDRYDTAEDRKPRLEMLDFGRIAC